MRARTDLQPRTVHRDCPQIFVPTRVLARLLARRVDGIFLSDFEQGKIGPDLFRHACLLGLEGMVSKHRESLYRGGRFRHWIKIKNRQHPAFARVPDQF